MERFEPSRGLRENILSSIVNEERQRAKRYLAVSFAAAAASMAGIVFSIQNVSHAVAQSSFYHYFSLLFSDSDIVLSSWRAFLMSLVETMPLFAVTLALAAIVAFLASVRACTTTSGRSLGFSYNN